MHRPIQRVISQAKEQVRNKVKEEKELLNKHKVDRQFHKSVSFWIVIMERKLYFLYTYECHEQQTYMLNGKKVGVDG